MNILLCRKIFPYTQATRKVGPFIPALKERGWAASGNYLRPSQTVRLSDLPPLRRLLAMVEYLKSRDAQRMSWSLKMYVLTALINLLGNNAQHFLLILDDYHVITEQEVHNTLLYLHELVLLRHWLEQLPREVVHSRPRLCLASAQLLWMITPRTVLRARHINVSRSGQESATRPHHHEPLSSSLRRLTALVE